MGPVDYVALRLVRHYMPNWIAHRLLERNLIIRPGMETSAPAAAIRRFMDAIDDAREKVAGRRILIFGYGGRLEVALDLLRSGARHVVLVDPYVRPVPLPAARVKDNPFLEISGSNAFPSAEWLTIVHAPLRQYLSDGGAPVDMVLSNSVLEHVGNMAATVADLASATAPGGQHFHFVDLRDHFFKYPFEMLCYSEHAWRRFLNPGSNLNRLRIWDYEGLFSSHFPRVTTQVLQTDVPRFRAARARIRSEFLRGDEDRDATTHILLRAFRP